MKTQVYDVSVSHSDRGISYQIELAHEGLKLHRIIRGENKAIVMRKAALQIEEWDSLWAIADAMSRDRSERAANRRLQEEQKALAAEETREAQQKLEALSSLLNATLAVNDAIDWEQLKDRTRFKEQKPAPPTLMSPPEPPGLPVEPTKSDQKYVPQLRFVDKLIKGTSKNSHSFRGVRVSFATA